MRVEPLQRWARGIVVVMAAALVVVAVIVPRGMLRSDDRVPTDLVGGELIDPTTLYIGVAACNKEPRFEVVEAANRVTVTAYAASPGLGASDCQDGATVELQSPWEAAR